MAADENAVVNRPKRVRTGNPPLSTCFFVGQSFNNLLTDRLQFVGW